MKKGTRLLMRLVALILVLLLSIESMGAVVGDNDGAAFITKAEFDSLKNTFQAQIDRYNSSIDSKIDGAVASYLAGVTVAKTSNLKPVVSNWDKVCWQDYLLGAFNYAKWVSPGTSTPTVKNDPANPEIMRPIFDPYRTFYYGQWQFTTEVWTDSAGFDILMAGTCARRANTYILFAGDVPKIDGKGTYANAIPNQVFDLISDPNGGYVFSGLGDIFAEIIYSENQWSSGPRFNCNFEVVSDPNNQGRYAVCNNLGLWDETKLKLTTATVDHGADVQFAFEMTRTSVSPNYTWKGEIWRNVVDGVLYPPFYTPLYGNQVNLENDLFYALKSNKMQALNSRTRVREDYSNACQWTWPTQALATKQLNVWENLAVAYSDDTVVNGVKLHTTHQLSDKQMDVSECPTQPADITINKFRINNGIGVYAGATTRTIHDSTQSSWPTFTVKYPTWIRTSVNNISNGKFKDADGHNIKMNQGIQLINDIEKPGKVKVILTYDKDTSGSGTIPNSRRNKIKFDLKKTDFSTDTDDANYIKGKIIVGATASENKTFKRYEVDDTSRKFTVEYDIEKGDDLWLRISPINNYSSSTDKNLDFAKITDLIVTFTEE